MNHFLVLTNRIINVKYIESIYIQKNKYIISLIPKISGTIIAGFGLFSSIHDQIIIKNTENKHNYDIISNWIKSIENQKF